MVWSRPFALVLVALIAGSGGGLVACATFDEVEGVPDALYWSYFRATPAEVVEATRRVLTLSGYAVEAVADGGGGSTVLTVTTSPPGADFTEVRIEGAAARDYRARAQAGPPGRRLPRELERRISAEL